MRASRWAVAAGTAMVLPMLFACGPAREPDQAPVVAQFTEGSSAASQAHRAVDDKGHRNLDECRAARAQGVYPRERRFPCEAFLGE
jgi:hypothetical protein